MSIAVDEMGNERTAYISADICVWTRYARAVARHAGDVPDGLQVMYVGPGRDDANEWVWVTTAGEAIVIGTLEPDCTVNVLAEPEEVEDWMWDAISSAATWPLEH